MHGTQTVSDGQALRLRLLEPMAVDDRLIPKGTLLTGSTRIRGERLDVLVETVEYKGAVIPGELEVYDADGGQGILVPNSLEYDAVREIAANMGTSMGEQHQHLDGRRRADSLGRGERRDTGRVTVRHQEDAGGENHAEGRAQAAAPYPGAVRTGPGGKRENTIIQQPTNNNRT